MSGHRDPVVGHAVTLPRAGWPRTTAAVAEASLALRARMRTDLEAALAETGRSLPGPLPPGETEPDPGDDVTERTA